MSNSSHQQPPVIAVYAPGQVVGCGRMLEALGQLYGVAFVPTGAGGLPAHKFVWMWGGSRQEALGLADQGIRVLAFAGGTAVPINDAAAPVEFSGSMALPPGFRGRSLQDGSLRSVRHLEVAAGDAILAQKGGHPLWVRVPGPGPVDLVAMPLPELAEKAYLFEFFHEEKWAGLLPVLHFLKEVSPWTAPPLRACFMFDDPNLHWPTYGYADYRNLAREAEEHHYHASFATVPVDAWYTDRRTAAIFQHHPQQLSFVIHGNNHTNCELSLTEGDDNRRKLAAQALQRIGRLEQRTGLAIPRVMVPPHESCSHEMAEALLRAGFEAACISRASLRGRNPGLTWPGHFGMEPSGFLGEGLPVIPRFNIRLGREAELNVLLAAFLGQPIIPVGHHDDLAGGPGLLRQLSGLINSLGEVAWLDLNRMAETNYSTCREGDTLGIRMYARRIRLTVPDGVTQLWVDRPWLKPGSGKELVLRAGGAAQSFSSYEGALIPVTPGQAVELGSIHPESFDPWSMTVPSTPLWALLRRQLCEVRDRLRPLRDWWFGSLPQPLKNGANDSGPSANQVGAPFPKVLGKARVDEAPAE